MLIDALEPFQAPAIAASLVVDHRGNVCSVAPQLQERLEWRTDSLIGRPFMIMMDPREAPVHQARFDWAIHTGDSQEYDTRVRTRTGDLEHVRLRMEPISMNGHPVVVLTLSSMPLAPHQRARLRATDEPETTATIGHERTGVRSAVALCIVEGSTAATGGEGDLSNRAVSRIVAERIAEHSRSTDIVALTSEDAMVIALIGVHGLRDTRWTLRRLREAAIHPIPTPSGDIRPLVSMKVAHAHATT